MEVYVASGEGTDDFLLFGAEECLDFWVSPFSVGHSCLLCFPNMVWWKFMLSLARALTASFSFGPEECLDLFGKTRFSSLWVGSGLYIIFFCVLTISTLRM